MSAYTGTTALTRLALRRDRVMIAAWAVLLTSTVAGTAKSFTTLYDTQAERADLARDMNDNPSLRAFYGPMFDWDSGGAISAWRFTVLGAAFVGLMAALIVVRHSRDEEETGRQELLTAGAVGRRAPLAAALLTACGASVLVAACCALALLGYGGGAAGAFAFGGCLAAGGFAFAGIAALAAQLTETGRAARGIAGAVLGAAFLLRAAGDSADTDAGSPLVWASPLGWIENVRPYGDSRPWLLLAPLALGAAAVAAAYALAARRDLGAGLLAARNGRAAATSSLAGPFGLAWRLQRGALLGWAAAFAVAGVVYGGVSDGVGDLVDDNKDVADIITRMGGGQTDITDAFLASAMGIFGLLAAVYAVQAVLRLRAEETTGRAEPVLAGAVPRLRWTASHLVFALLGPVVLLAVGGLGAGIAHGEDIGRLVAAGVAQTPAVWVLAAAGAALFGLLPRATIAVWALIAVCGVLGQLGPALQLPQAVMDLSPFTHLPKLPGGTVSGTPYALLAAVGAALTAAGLAGVRRRDLGA
jgi:ABC-2 type transport system permease protein